MEATRSQFVAGMPALSFAGLSENWLLKTCGDRHWQQLAAMSGLSTPDFRDADGNKVYAAFTAIRIKDASLEEVGENDAFTIDSFLKPAGGAKFLSEHVVVAHGACRARVTMLSTFIRRTRERDNRSVVRAMPTAVQDGSTSSEAVGGLHLSALARRFRTGDWGDSDDDEAKADVGMAGVAIDSVEDMLRLFEGIPLEQVSVSMTMNGAVLPVLAAFLAAAEERGVPFQSLRGTIQNDILKEFMVRHTWIHAPQPSLRIATDVVEWLAMHAPKFNGMSISGYHFQEAGADPALELALTLANATVYVGELNMRGLDIDAFCAGLSFFFGVGKNFFVEIAKLRAARILWHDIVREQGGTSARATAMRMHCQTSGWTLAAQQPLNNISRTTVEAMAAIFGGTQSLHTNGFDEALALPSPQASRLARDTQLILQHEFGLCDVADPWAGSYLVESLTAQMVSRVKAILVEIEEEGGILKALESGWIHSRIHQFAVRTQARLDAGDEVVVGVNRYQEPEENPQERLDVDGTHVRAQQTRRLVALRQCRDEVAVKNALAALRQPIAAVAICFLVPLTRCGVARPLASAPLHCSKSGLGMPFAHPTTLDCMAAPEV